MDVYEGLIFDAYKKVCKKDLSKHEAHAIWQGLMSFRYLSNRVFESPGIILKELFTGKAYDHLIYPCDVIELRYILRNKNIKDNNKIPFFGFKFAHKYLSRYPVFIILNGKKIDSTLFTYGAMRLAENSQANIDEAILRVVVNQPVFENVPETVLKITKEELPEIGFHVNDAIPGQSFVNPRLFADFDKKSEKKYNFTKMAQAFDTDVPLNEREQRIFSLIRDANRDLNLGIDFRVAGGWVRDKLLGKGSDDIDIAVNKMPGFDVAKALADYANKKGIEGIGEAYSVSLEKSADPAEETKDDQLMVGGIDIFGQKIEFVPMRVEYYDEDSRTPKVKRTDNVLEDVKRRDLTINAMYYNINTGEVEDYVNGKEDLENMHLRTPADPMETLTEDPLRSLRVLRFLSKFPTATIDQSIIEAMKSPEVHMAYINKVHPSRASKEIKKMLGAERPVDATRILFETGLYKPVFKIPEDWNEIGVDQQTPHHRLSLMEHTLEVMKNYSKLYNEMDKELPEHKEAPENEKALMMLSTMFHDFGKMHPEIRKPKVDKKTGEPILMDKEKEHMTYIGHEDVSSDFANQIMTEMGFEPAEKKFVSTIVQYHMRPHSFDEKTSPKHFGKFLHKVDKLYKHIMDHAEADAISKGFMEDEKVEQIRNERKKNLERLQQYRSEMGELIYKPIINGNKIREIAQSIDPEMVSSNATVFSKEYDKPVHFMSYLIDKMKEQQWQQRIRSPEDAEQWLFQAVKNFGATWRNQLKGKSIPKKFVNDPNFNTQNYVKNQPAQPTQQPVQPYIESPQEQEIVNNDEEQQTNSVENKKFMGWYKRNKIKEAQNTDFNSYEGLDDDVIFLEKRKSKPKGKPGPTFEKHEGGETYLNDVVSVPYNIGDKLRWRWGTVDSGNQMAEQVYGTVVDIKDNKLIIDWEGKKEHQEIPLNDTKYLAQNIERI